MRGQTVVCVAFVGCVETMNPPTPSELIHTVAAGGELGVSKSQFFLHDSAGPQISYNMLQSFFSDVGGHGHASVAVAGVQNEEKPGTPKGTRSEADSGGSS